VAASQQPAEQRSHPSWLPAISSKPVLHLDPVTVRVLITHVIAMLAVVIVLLADSFNAGRPHASALELAVFIGFASLRIVSARRTLATSTLVLDAIGTVLFLAGTDAPSSPYFFLALAGAWWAAHVRRPHSGAVWAVAFVAAYAILVVPGAVRGQLLVHALEDASVVFIVALLSDWFVRVDVRAIALSEALAKAPAGAEKLAIREGLRKALGPMEISMDVLLAASREGLTVLQAELLAYLVLGLTNQEIADATSVGEATVRYRLTRLYRALGVRGRKAAIARAQELGVEAVDRT
jgi:DNA-binding CsgD family transcriptional regulator